MVRRLLVGLVATGLLLVGAPAFAQPPVTETTVQKNLVETFVDVVPTCEGGGPLYTITTTSNLVEHTTTFDDGRVHASFTQTGTLVAVPLEDPSLPATRADLPSIAASPERQGRQRHLHRNRPWDRLGRVDVEGPHHRPLQPAARRHGQRLLPLPPASTDRGSAALPGLGEPVEHDEANDAQAHLDRGREVIGDDHLELEASARRVTLVSV